MTDEEDCGEGMRSWGMGRCNVLEGMGWEDGEAELLALSAGGGSR